MYIEKPTATEDAEANKVALALVQDLINRGYGLNFNSVEFTVDPVAKVIHVNPR